MLESDLSPPPVPTPAAQPTPPPDNQQPDDDEVAFLQTQRALQEALKEQKILREKLSALESRNRPAKWGKAVFVQSIDATRGRFENEGELAPEQLVSELKTAQHMLENAKRASEAARAEKKHLEIEIAQLAISAKQETDSLLQANALHHKQFLQAEQQQFRNQMTDWGTHKSELQTQAEKLGLVSHDILHQSSQAKKGVDEQRRTITALATQLRNDLGKSKELKDALDDAKAKVALIDNLSTELQANHDQANQLRKNIIEQKQILRAVRVSAQARRMLDEIAEQTDELMKAKSDAEQQVAAVSREAEAILQKEETLKKQLDEAQIKYKQEQMALLVLESEMKELQAEFERVKTQAVVEGRRNVELHKTIREEKMDATVRYLATHAKDIHRVDRVQSTLMSVRQQLHDRTLPRLPPLRPERRSASALMSLALKS
jgi:sugar-specific transcriptional regulator TrmB